MMTAFENSTYIKPSLTTSWLRDFLGYVESSRGYGDTDLSIVTEQDFVTTLRDIYLADQVGSRFYLFIISFYLTKFCF